MWQPHVVGKLPFPAHTWAWLTDQFSGIQWMQIIRLGKVRKQLLPGMLGSGPSCPGVSTLCPGGCL